MGLFNKMKEPVFLKESSNMEVQIEKLKALELFLNKEGQSILKQDIKYLEYGIIGEKNIAFELANSHYPMYILHDIYLESGDLNAQIDYLVVTRKLCFVIECKNLYGNVEINTAGDFIRTMEFGGRKIKEGIYSPITQNQRHLELMKKIKLENKKNILTQLMAKKYFDDFNKPVVVLANPKTILNAKYAKKEIKEQVLRADQLVKYIKDTCQKSKEAESSDEQLLSWAQSYLSLHKEIEKNYTTKYEQYKMESEEPLNITIQEKLVESPVNKVETPPLLEETALFMALKQYRLDKSREETIKPYFIYNNNQLKDLISKMPRTKEELKAIDGFGEMKSNKYGDEILQIISKHC